MCVCVCVCVWFESVCVSVCVCVCGLNVCVYDYVPADCVCLWLGALPSSRAAVNSRIILFMNNGWDWDYGLRWGRGGDWSI